MLVSIRQKSINYLSKAIRGWTKGYDNPTITESQAIEITQPLIQPTKDFLLSYYEIDLNDFFSPNDPRIAILGVFALEVKRLEDQGVAIDTSYIDFGIGEPIGDLLTYKSQYPILLRPGETLMSSHTDRIMLEQYPISFIEASG
ncbi:MAG: hypothetical protein IPH58_10400 [Sphingobacteriales bacterium]|nr:hypothetical protein [Sphingobacteriales bacterium]